MSTLIRADALGFEIPYLQSQKKPSVTSTLSLMWDVYAGRKERTFKPILKDLSFAIESGERVALIGPNGAGKSTLLRILARVYRPTHGTLEFGGRPEGIFDMSLGFDQEATGRENVYLRGLRLGLPSAEIAKRLNDVVQFANIEQVLDQPIATYSNGMRYRLAFAISTLVVPDILLLDEWIGAGDAHFRQKAEQRMRAIIDSSRAIVLASHNEALLGQICTRGLVLAQGSLVFDGPIEEALQAYNARPAGATT